MCFGVAADAAAQSFIEFDREELNPYFFWI